MSLYPEQPILIVDDEKFWLLTIEALLKRRSRINNIITCSDSSQVIALLNKREFSLVILDYMMPNCTGKEILTFIAKDYPQLPVLMMSGTDDDEVVTECKELGAKDFLLKTLQENKLLTAIENCM